MAQLFKPVQSQKVPFGVDPKSVLCVYFKNGNCEKGTRCKFSHDLSVERKSQKKNIYEDVAAEEEEKKRREETSENWDEEKLRSVVLSKQGNPKTTTDKVCKFFIDAVENGKYGWFWQCILPIPYALTRKLLIEDRPEWWKRLQIQTFAAAGICLENQGAKSSRKEGSDG